MTSVQIPFIEFTNNRIQKSSIIIDNNQFNVEFKDGKYVVSKGNTMSETSSPAQTDMKSSAAPAPAPAPAKNANEKPKETESTKSVAQTNDKSETQKTETRPDPKPLKSVSKTIKEPIKRKLTDREIMMQDLFKAIALRKKTVDEREKGAKVEQVQKEKKEEEAKPTESKYKTYNTMKKIGQPEEAIRQKMIQNGIEKKEIDDYFKSQEYQSIQPSSN